MKLTVLGSSAGTPTRTNPASGYLIEHEGATVWLDAGPGTFMALAAITDPGQLDAVVISHVHVDHCSDLFGLYGYLAYGPSGHVPIPVFVTQGATELFAAFAGASGEHVFHSVLDFREVGPADTDTVGPFEFEFGAGHHAVTNNITRVTTAAGTIVYSGDTGPSPDLVATARDADLFVCEATMVGSRDDQTYPYHLTAGEAGEAAASARVGHLVVTHISHLVESWLSVAEAGASFDGPISYAARGATFEI
ncbi:MAG: MBL fold metallo-hydrolase [Acidimicrobiia bacterium]